MMETRRERILIHVDPDLEDLVPLFVANRERDIVTLRDAIARGDLQTVQDIGHSMKGAGGGYGFDRVTDLGDALEIAAKQGNAEPLARLVDELEDYMQRVEVSFD